MRQGDRIALEKTKKRRQPVCKRQATYRRIHMRFRIERPGATLRRPCRNERNIRPMDTRGMYSPPLLQSPDAIVHESGCWNA